MAQSLPIPSRQIHSNIASSPSNSTPSATSFVSSTPTASLRSSTTAKRVSLASLDPEFGLESELDHPLTSTDRGRDRRIQKWLQQQCGDSLAWELKKGGDISYPELRHTSSSRTILSTSNSPATPVTNASFSWGSDQLVSVSASHSSPPSSPSVPVPLLESYEFANEKEAVRADSPLLGIPDLNSELTAPTTLPEANRDTAKSADVDKPLPRPPSEATLMSAIAVIETPISPLLPAQRSLAAQTSFHSRTSSSSSSRQSHIHTRNHSSSQFSAHHSAVQLPIGVGRIHPHARTPSGSSSSGHGVQGRMSKSPSSLSLLQSLQSGVSISLATLARRHEVLSEDTRQTTIASRNRSSSNAIPSAKQFHLPTGMIHRSQSHAQLRTAGPVFSSPLNSNDQTSTGLCHLPMNPSSSVSRGAVAPRLVRKHSKQVVVSPPTSRTHSKAPSYASTSVASRDEVSDHVRSRLDTLESRVPSISSSFSRNAVYMNSDSVAKLDQLLLLAKEEMETRMVEVDETEDVIMEVPEEGTSWIDVVKSNEGSINQIGSPPNTPATGYFGSALSLVGSHTASATSVVLNTSSRGSSSRVLLHSSRNNSIEKSPVALRDVEPICSSTSLPVVDPDATIREIAPATDLIPQERSPPYPPAPSMNMSSIIDAAIVTEEESMEDALSLARELAVDDRMVWGVRMSLEVFDDCCSESEDEGPIRLTLRDENDRAVRDDGLVVPSVSKWSPTSSVYEEKRMSTEEGKPRKKKRRSFVPFIVSGDKSKEDADDDDSIYKENGSKKRSRLASFISRLSSVGLGGSGSNTPSLHSPPLPSLSSPNMSHALPTLFTGPSKWDSPSMPSLTPNFSAKSSRSSSPIPIPDPPLQQQPQVTVIADDDDANPSSSSSERLVDTLTSTPTCNSAVPSPTIQPQLISSRRPIPPGLVIPPLPNCPPPLPPMVPPPLVKAASEGIIKPDGAALGGSLWLTRPRSNSTIDLLGKHVTFSSTLPSPFGLSPRLEGSMTMPSSLRRSVLVKSASSSMLGLHQQLKPVNYSDPAGTHFDDGMTLPTPTSTITFSEEFDEPRRRQDGYDDPSKHPRLRAISSLGALSNGAKGKGGIKGFVGRLTGRGKKSPKPIPPEFHTSPTLSSGDCRNIDETNPSTVTAPVVNTPSMLKHSPTGSFVGDGDLINVPVARGSGVLSGFISYLEKTHQS